LIDIVDNDALGCSTGRVLSTGTAEELIVDREQYKVLLGDEEIELVFQEFELLEFLTAHPYRVFTREELLDRAWSGRTQATTRTVDVHVHRLRRKLGPGYAQHLVTVRRVGYTFRPPPSRRPMHQMPLRGRSADAK
jgi:DNA-binding response OmpR family regulator